MKKLSGKHLLIGPVPPPVNGQSLCFKVLVDSLPNAIVVDRNVDQLGRLKKAIIFIKAFSIALANLLFNRIDGLYISISRSWPGMIFDCTIILIAKVFSKRMVLHLHGNDFLVSNTKRRLFSWVYSTADHFIALSEPMKSYLESIVSCPVKVIMNPIQEFFYEAQSQKSDGSIIRVVYLSNIMFSKGIFDFVQLARICWSQQMEQKFEFHVIGKFLGDKTMTGTAVEDRFKSELSSLGNIQYHGPLYGKSLSDMLGSMDVLVFPSFYPVEALPLSVLEAASQSLYIVVNDHNDLNIFQKLLPHVHVMDTSRSNELLHHLTTVGIAQIRKMGEENQEKSLTYSVKNHVNKVKALLNLT
jgi:glycosyltransferase involved in cell wall biosynthesis